jgi:hypothetical protein
VPRSRMSRSYTSSPPSTSMACSGTAVDLGCIWASWSITLEYCSLLCQHSDWSYDFKCHCPVSVTASLFTTYQSLMLFCSNLLCLHTKLSGNVNQSKKLFTTSVSKITLAKRIIFHKVIGICMLFFLCRGC